MTATTATPSQVRLAEWTKAFGHALAHQWTSIDRHQPAPLMRAVGTAIETSPWRIALKTAPLAAVIWTATNRALALSPRAEVRSAGDWAEVALSLDWDAAKPVITEIVKDCVGIRADQVDMSAEGEVHGV